jgi:hypothetical protein
MTQIKCEKCGSLVECREGWIDDCGEYRHIEYSYCDTCKDIRTSDGKFIFSKPSEIPPILT